MQPFPCFLLFQSIMKVSIRNCKVKEAGRLLFTDHIPRSLTCKGCIAKCVTVNGVNSNAGRTKQTALKKKEKVAERIKKVVTLGGRR